MSQAVFLVLSLLGEPSAQEREVIARFERTRLVRLDAPKPQGGLATYPAYDSSTVSLVSELEADLDRARTAAVSLDETRALELLASVEARLREHPELPQSAWLMAERLRLSATQSARRGNAALAARNGAGAAVLEGSRSAEFGEAEPSQPMPAAQTVAFEGLDPRDRLELDGQPLSGRDISLMPGEHHVRIVRGGRLVLARWVRIGAGARAVDLALPPLEPCSAEDLSGLRLEDGRVKPARGTRCSRWVTATRARGGLGLADCFGERCAPIVIHPFTRDPALLAFPAQPEREQPSNLLVKIAVAGSAALLLGTAIVWQAGAFDDEPKARSQWVYGGVSPAP